MFLYRVQCYNDGLGSADLSDVRFILGNFIWGTNE